MRVAMVTARYRPHQGGIETHVHEVGRRISSRADVTVLTTDPEGMLPSEEHLDGVVVRRFPARPRDRDYYWAPSLMAAIRDGRYDLVHVQGVHTLLAPMALRAARLAGSPAVLTFHTGGSSSRLRESVRTMQWRLERTALRSARLLIAVCEYEIEQFSRSTGLSPDRFALIRNGADPLSIGELDPGLIGSPLICSVGRLERYKGHHRAIGAMPELLRIAPAARLVIVGSGPYEAELRATVERLGVHDAVCFRSFGPTERAGLGALVKSSDLVVLLSEYEAHPVAVMEAVALGREVLVANTSGLTELGRMGLAHLFDLGGSPRSLAETMLMTSRCGCWRSGPPVLPSWDDCAEDLYVAYETVLAAT